MRLTSPFIALALGAALAVATSANATSQRVNGSYTSVTTHDANACARACADDGLCIAWIRHADGACALMAIAPETPAPTGTEAGIASRAPSFAAWPAPSAATEPVIALPIATQETAFHQPETEATLALLGGPDGETLRPRLGGRQ
ncbi:hypothetical protein [Terricaulis silvestris]|nr:hypothetical protein [Terricaulis silvestris]